MRGMPRFIQTPADLNNLFTLTQTGEIKKQELTEAINVLLAKQYFRVPVLSIDGKVVTTRYFFEAEAGNTTEGGATITAVEHMIPAEDELPDDADQTPTVTKITLSKAPAGGTTMLAVFKPVNFLTENGFDLAQINYVLGVLAQ